jgi:hypothetical protein
MTAAFTPIRIIGINQSASGPSDQGAAMTRVVLDLSEQAPPEWANFFNQRWVLHIYMMKRRAQVSGKRLEIDCVLDELEGDHLPELNKVFDETNSEYSKFYTARQAARQAEQAKREAEAAKLAELKKNIKFE